MGFLYDGCDPQYRISQGVGEHMAKLFSSLKKVTNYSIDDLNKYTQKKRCCWSAILGVPFLIFGCCCSFIYWDSYFENKLKERREDIQKKLTEFEHEKLHSINPNLELTISAEGGYIQLKIVNNRRYKVGSMTMKKGSQRPQHQETADNNGHNNRSVTSLNNLESIQQKARTPNN